MHRKKITLEYIKKIKVFLKNKDALIFFSFLLISFFFWYLHVMKKQYNIQIPVKLSYTNVPLKTVNIDDLPKEIQVSIQDQGFYLLAYKYKKTKKINLNLHNANEDKRHLFISNKELENSLKKILLSSTKINKTYPERISIKKVKKGEKKIAVKLNKDLSFVPQYNFSNSISITPDSITAYGDYNLLKDINLVNTEKIKLNNIKDTLNLKVALKKIKNIDFFPDSVEVNIPVDKFTEKVLEIPIEVINKPEELNIKLFPSFINVRFFVTLNKFNAVSKNDLKAYVNYKEISESEFLNIHIDNFKPFIFNIRTNINQVEYLIEIN